MEPQLSAKRGINIHPCYKIANISHVVRSSPSTMCVLIYTFLSLLSVITICGNLLVITSIIYFKQLHTPTNSLILSLAVADLLVGIIVFPFSMAFSLSSCMYNVGLFCKVRDGIAVTLCTSSILHLCCISIDRYYAVCQPLTYERKINDRVVKIVILISWNASVIVATGLVLNQDICKEKCLLDAVVATAVGTVFSFYFPMIIMLCFYLKIFLVAQRQARSIQNTAKSGAAVSKMERKATKTLATIMGVFLMCWLPLFLCMPFYVGDDGVPLALSETLHWIGLCNSMLNPFIYAFFYSWFRAAFRMIISGKIFQGDFADSKLQ